MNSILEDLIEKNQETLDFIELIDFIDNAGSEIKSSDGEKSLHIKPNLRKTLKGLVFLLMYNTVESTMRDCIYRIHEEMGSKNINFDDLRDDIKKHIIQQLKTHSSLEYFVSNIQNISIDICHKLIDQRKIFSGNIDHRAIQKTAEKYGIDLNQNKNFKRNGQRLLIIKSNRNSLAHGEATFSGVGKNYALSDLQSMNNETAAYLEDMIEHIQAYMSNSSYLSINQAPATF